ncbi:MAG: efflux RND transporter periplasmic adaptor subunit [Haliea sp.]|uniref:efflux RND transporter periplasmic adaptor subunit n=1 Tax=Haliea sp. TaxID=1932666 RepID=UPI0032EE98B8
MSSLGRLEPLNGIIRLSGPSSVGVSGSVIKELSVEEGDWVEKDQIVAFLDSYQLRRAEVARLEAILDNAQREMARQQDLARTSATSRTQLDAATMELSIARADLAAAQARLELSVVRSPLRAQVLEIHSYPGESVGPDGILELAQTDRMYAVAEVYETDISLVRVGQAAVVKAPALGDGITGKVERIALKVGRMDVLGTDPIAKTDARVVEVFILLDSSDNVSGLTNMQVEVEIKS